MSAVDEYRKALKKYDDPLTKNYDFKIASEYIAALEAELVERDKWERWAREQLAEVEFWKAQTNSELRRKWQLAASEIARLRVCGNCYSWASMLPYMPDLCSAAKVGETEMTVDECDHCHFTPSRWTAREEAGDER